MPFLWIDPPHGGENRIHEIDGPDDIPDVLGQYDIPDDNEAARRAYDVAHEGESVEQYQAGREFWGVTYLNVAPHPVPDGVTMVGPEHQE